jgi:O-antigen/teichoic acid export membrane protein
MGIIQRQSIKGTIYSYIGVIIGFVTTALFFPRILSTEEIGLLKLLVSFSIIFAQLGSLGFNSVLYRLFPYFRNPQKGHNGFLSVAMIVSILGTLISFILLKLLSATIISNNIESSTLFVDYFYLLYPLILFTIFFNLFDTYNRALYDAVSGTILKELVQRIFILLSIIVYFFDLISVKQFVYAYTISLSLPTLILYLLLVKRKHFLLSKPSHLFTKPMIKDMIDLSFFGIIGGFGSMAIFQVDSILINKYLGLGPTGIYATNFYFGSLILISSRTLLRISATVISESWKRNDLINIADVYKKSAINQAVISLILFVLLWLNIENIYHILPEKFAIGKWVIFYIGLANVIEMSTGANSMIIQTSKYYRVNTVFIFIWLGLLILTNILLIPVYGITGAAIGTLFSNAFTNLLRFGFLRIKFNMQPFGYKSLTLLLIGAGSYLAAAYIPRLNNFIFDIIVRSGVCIVLFVFLVIRLKISEEINKEYTSLIQKILS